MSAICGMIDWRGGPVGPSVRKALAALERHGRDGKGFWDGGNVALGWRQTILVAEDYADEQPLTGGAGRFKLVFDGRIDNREELTGRLSLDAEEARSWPDGRYVLAAFEKWGQDCVPHLLGDFAFAVWNSTNRELFLVRDHIGTHQLHLYRGNHFIIFATVPSALFTCPQVPRDLDDEHFIFRLAALQLEPNATLYRDIERVPIGHALVIREEGVSPLRHWNPESMPLLRYKRDEDYVEAFKSILHDAVECRLRTLHPLGSHLSSGWDSSTVTATAASILGERSQRITAFTAVPPEKWRPGIVPPVAGVADEGPIAAAVARQFPNIDHVLIRGTNRLELEAMDRYGDAREFPTKIPNNAGWQEHLYRDAHSRGIRVMLSAGMGNRTLSYDGLQLLPCLFRKGRWFRLAQEWKELHRRGFRHRGLSALAFGPYLPEFVWNGIWRYFRISKRTADMCLGINPLALSEERLSQIAPRSGMSPASAHRVDDRSMRRLCTLTPDNGWLWASTLFAYDIETRDPSGDRRLMAFRAVVPEEQYLSKGQTKWLARRAMADTLPELLFNQTGRGQQAAEWFDAATRTRAELAAEIDRIAANRRLSSLVDVPFFQGCLNAWPDRIESPRQSMVYRRFLMGIAVARFARRFIEQTPSGS